MSIKFIVFGLIIGTVLGCKNAVETKWSKTVYYNSEKDDPSELYFLIFKNNTNKDIMLKNSNFNILDTDNVNKKNSLLFIEYTNSTNKDGEILAKKNCVTYFVLKNIFIDDVVFNKDIKLFFNKDLSKKRKIIYQQDSLKYYFYADSEYKYLYMKNIQKLDSLIGHGKW
jgi:hypothetical protein